MITIMVFSWEVWPNIPVGHKVACSGTPGRAQAANGCG
jgi:hypothetical protein